MSDKQCADGSPEKTPAPDKRPVTIKPAKKVGEGPGNLRRREAWYQKRTGGGKRSTK